MFWIVKYVVSLNSIACLLTPLFHTSTASSVRFYNLKKSSPYTLRKLVITQKDLISSDRQYTIEIFFSICDKWSNVIFMQHKSKHKPFYKISFIGINFPQTHRKIPLL